MAKKGESCVETAPFAGKLPIYKLFLLVIGRANVRVDGIWRFGIEEKT